MAQPEQSASLVSQSRLLGLPGEIRNRIYEYVIEPTRVRLKPPNTTPKASDIFELCPAATVSWGLLNRKALGLTQACHQLREEVLPLHRLSVTVTIAAHHVDKYIVDFGYKPKTAVGTLVVDATGKCHTINILPLMRLNGAAPNFVINFKATSKSDKQRLERLMDFNTNRKWCKYTRLLTEVCYKTGGGFGLTVKVKAPVKEHWMPWDKEAGGRDKPSVGQDFGTKWVKRVGLGNKFCLLRLEFVSVPNWYLLGDEELT